MLREVAIHQRQNRPVFSRQKAEEGSVSVATLLDQITCFAPIEYLILICVQNIP